MENAEFEEVLPKLLNIALFEGFDGNNENDRRILKIFYDNVTIRMCKAGEVIIREGDIGDEFYILRSGSVHIYRETLSGDNLALADLNADMNIFFGETALIGKDARSATVQALTDCRLIVLSSRKFHEICEKEPVFAYKVLLVLARRLIKTVNDLNKDKAILYEALFKEISSVE